MPLSDAGKIVWRGGASSYIFVKDFTNIQKLALDPLEDFQRSADGTLKGFKSTTVKHKVQLFFENVGATQKNQMATIWKANTVLDFYEKQTDATALGSFWWIKGLNFAYSRDGIYYKNLWDGKVNLEEQ